MAKDDGRTTTRRPRPRDTTNLGDPEYQEYALAGVSRTFALAIPQLPPALRDAVGNAYLLCRIADTIEDDPGLSAEDGSRFAGALVAAVAGDAGEGRRATEIADALSPRTAAAERDLVAHLPRVVRHARAQAPGTRRAVLRCLETMTEGMARFQGGSSAAGLPGTADVDRYCYHVAGVVGEMLTEIFAGHVPAIAARKAEMLPLAVSFGTGLQKTNILKDVWDDRARGACWLPRDLFARHGVDLEHLERERQGSGFGEAIAEMAGLAHANLSDGLSYTLMIPSGERGLRRFCVLPLVLALLTLRRVLRHPGYRAGETVRVSRAHVAAAVAATRAAAGHDRVVAGLFDLAGRGLQRPAAPAPVDGRGP